MNESTDGVTLYAGFVFDVLEEYKGMKKLCRPAFEMAAELDPNEPWDWVPMKLYNDVCAWVEENVGQASIRRAGRAIGARAYAQMVSDGKLGASPSPPVIMKELARVASEMIRDPQKRGWEIRDEQSRRLIMRRTQTFNCILQEGLLLSLVEKTGVLMPGVRHINCTRGDAEFCDYEVSWLTK